MKPGQDPEAGLTQVPAQRLASWAGRCPFWLLPSLYLAGKEARGPGQSAVGFEPLCWRSWGWEAAGPLRRGWSSRAESHRTRGETEKYLLS